jgi:hypothetical protein
MCVVCHKTKPVDAAAKLLHNELHYQIQTVPVSIIKKDRLPSVTTKNNMVDCAGIMNARFACHEDIINENSRKSSLTP